MSDASDSAPDLDAFRSEVRSWLAENVPVGIGGVPCSIDGVGHWGGRRATYDPPELMSWLDRMAA
jgi:hypothetical protein